MPEMTALSLGFRKKRLASFTLIELLTVMAIIIILASLMLFAGNGVIQKAKRSRASGEIQAMSTALEGYKTDNGTYPPSDGVLMTNNYASSDGTSSSYQTNGTVLFTSLTGENYYGQSTGLNTGAKSYMVVKLGQVGNPAGPFSYIQDPWTFSYGYSTASSGSVTPYNGTGFFDLWSTGGLKAAQANTSAWLCNWQ